MRWTGITIAGVALLSLASAAPAAIVTGIDTSTSYGLYNGLYQWEFGATAATSTYLGKVALGAGGVFNYNIMAGDVAMLSDGRVAITHKDDANTKWQISVLTPQYDGGGLLTGVNVDATFDQESTVQCSLIAPLPSGGFVTAKSSNAVVYELTAPNTWTPTVVSGLASASVYDVAGLITEGTTQFVTGEYVTPPGGSGARSGHKYDKTGKLARYYSDLPSLRAWGYGNYNQKSGEGLRTPLLSNGWITSGYTSESYPSILYDGTQTDGNWYMGAVGKITNSDGTEIYDKQWAALGDGRVVTVWASGWLRNDADFRVYTLVQDPGGRTGTVGANGEDYQVTLGSSASGSKDNFVGMISGDYMYVPEPATMALLALGSAGLVALRRRRK